MNRLVSRGFVEKKNQRSPCVSFLKTDLDLLLQNVTEHAVLRAVVNTLQRTELATERNEVRSMY